MPRSAYSCIRSATVSGSPTRAVPAPPRTRPIPAHKSGLISKFERSPWCSSAILRWPTESILANTFWASAMVSSSRWEISCSAALQASSRVSRTITCSRIPKRTERPSCSASCRTAAILALTCSGGSPQVRYTSICLAAVRSAASDEPPKYSGG
ncbi:hypothetical protein D3C73_1272630 [compost metagenome]